MIGGVTNVAPPRVLALISLALALATIALLPDRAAAASGWQIVLDRPTPNFGAVDFVSDSEGWMPAGAGLLHTTDGGATWTEAAKITVADVDFFDQQHGWAVGLSGTIYGTSDGGTTWVQQTSHTNVHLSHVEAVGASEAWVVGTGEGYSDIAPFPPVPSVLLHTTDGGNTWRPVDAGPNTSYREIAAATHDVWALAERCEASPDSTYCQYGTDTTLIRHSSDGGTTWEALTAPASGVSHLTFANEDDGWLTASACAIPDCLTKSSAIFRTTDGGTAWQAIDTSAYGTIESLTFQDAQRGAALASDCRANPCLTNLLTTDDGGATWNQLSQNASNGSTYGQSLVVHGSALYRTGRSRLALRSLDAGRTWQDMQTPALTLDEVDFVDHATGFALDGTSLVRTDDEGRTWQHLGGDFPPFIAEYASPAKIGFFDTSTGVVVSEKCAPTCHPEVSRTIDGGSTWNVVASFVSENISPVMKIDVGAGGAGMVVGANGLIITSDYGATWHFRDVPPDLGGSITDADLVDATHLWATVIGRGNDEPVFRLIQSRNSGSTWSVLAEATGQFYGSIRFVDAGHGWYVGGQKCTDNCPESLFSTDDGGTSWQAVESGLAFQDDLVFVDRLNGWATANTCAIVCGGPELVHTSDGGRTWNAQFAGDTVPTNLDMVDARAGWFTVVSPQSLGLGGGPPQRTLLYHTTDGGGGPIGKAPPDFPDVGGGLRAAHGSPMLPLLLGGAGAMALAASFVLRRRPH